MLDRLKKDSSGFRLRGLQMTRIETFTDAAFAFALTLLVVSLDPPSSFSQLGTVLRGVPAFLLSASMLMMFWWGHHEWSRRYGLDDVWTLLLSCGLVFTVLIYVYPLRFMFQLMMTWISQMTGLPLGSGASITDYQDVNRIFLLYGIGFTIMSATLVLLNRHAWNLRDVLQLDVLERHEARAVTGAWVILMLAGLLSSVAALLLPPSFVGAPGWMYAMLGVAMPIYGQRMNRRRLKILESTSEDATGAP